MDNIKVAYLSGILKGDGCIDRVNTNPRFVVDTTSQAFAQEIAKALISLKFMPRFSRNHHVRKWAHLKKIYYYDIKSYRMSCTIPKFFASNLVNFSSSSREEKIEFIKGIFQSEGTMRTHIYPNRRICYMIRIYNKNISLLRKFKIMISEFGIKMILREYNNHIPFLDNQNKNDFNKFKKIFGEKIK